MFDRYTKIVLTVIVVTLSVVEHAQAEVADGRPQQLAQCEIDADQMYPSFLDAPNGQPLAAIQLCMGAAGYRWVGFEGNQKCDRSHIMMGKPDLEGNGALCFAPKD